jgi:ribosome modulation factor
MSKVSEYLAVKAYSQGYMAGIYGDSGAEYPSKQADLKDRWMEGRSKGLAVRKMHSEKLRQKSFFTLEQT